MFESFGARLQTKSSNLVISMDTDQQSFLLNNQSYFTQKLAPSDCKRKAHGRDLSLRSVSTNKKQPIFKVLQRGAYEGGHSQSLSSQQATHHYESIQRVLQKQNTNLKQQNKYLLTQIQRLKSVHRNYKEICFEQQIELQHLREQCEVHKTRADQMKEVIMASLKSLEARVMAKEKEEMSDSGMSLLQVLSLSQTGVHQQS